MTDYQSINRRGWAQLAQFGCKWTIPFGPEQFKNARQLLDPYGWIPFDKIQKVLCLASGGGQQAPLFASLGKDVTVVDLSGAQLERDRQVAQQYGFSVRTIERDMVDLGTLHGESFDLVYQPVSSVYVPNIRPVYHEIVAVLRVGGWYYGNHWNPVYLQMPETGEWENGAYRLVYPQDQPEPITQTLWRIDDRDVEVHTVTFIHPLQDLIGGLCDVGLATIRFRESERGKPSSDPGTVEHVASYIPASFSVLARYVDIFKLL